MEFNAFAGKKLVIFDVDGTLYKQKGLRAKMMQKLIAYHLFRPQKWLAIPIILSYRKLREASADKDFGQKDMEEYFYEIVSKKYNCTPLFVKASVEKWMQKEPLPFLKKFQYKGITDFLKMLKTAGIQVAVYSDLPAVEKLHAMDLTFDLVVDSTMPEINCLKPHPKGLEYICSTLNTPKEKAIFIGDRISRDKACADRIQMDSIIVKDNDSFYLELAEKLKGQASN